MSFLYILDINRYWKYYLQISSPIQWVAFSSCFLHCAKAFEFDVVLCKSKCKQIGLHSLRIHTQKKLLRPMSKSLCFLLGI